MKEFELVAAVFIAALAAGLVMAWRFHQWQRRTRRVQGVVVDQLEAGESTVGTFYYAVVEFIDAGGQRIRFTDRLGHGGNPLFPTGSAVSVAYQLSDPEQAHIRNLALSRTIAIAAVVMGSVLLVIGLWPR